MTQRPLSSFADGVTALREGRLADAEQAFKTCLVSEPGNASALYNLGLVHFHSGNSAEAGPCLQKALALRPDHIDTQAMLAAVFADQNRTDEALTLARKIAISPDAGASALNTAGHVLAVAGVPEEAETAYRAALLENAAYRSAALAFANLLTMRGAFDEAAEVCEGCLAHHPRDQDLHLKRAQALWDAGQVARARDALISLLDFAPDHVTALYNLSLFATQSDPAVAIDRLSVLLSEAVLSPTDTIAAWFSLGNLYAAEGQYQESLACFTQGNSIRADRSTPVHDLSAEAFEHRVAELESVSLPPITPTAAGQPTPLIITGPSRSGKSLLQSCLAQHPDISAADETGLLPRLAEHTLIDDESGLKEAANTYRETLRHLGGDTRFVIDTHPVNALYLDLLLEMCPDAVVIQMSRDPFDLAVSIYARNFVTGGHWANTWDGIAKRIKAYDRLVAHWSSWPPVKANVTYESLIENPEHTVRSIIDALGLDWMDAVLPAKADGNTRIAPMPWASFPGTQPLRTDAVGLWKPFAPWLGSFADAYGRAALEDASEVLPYAHTPRSTLAHAIAALNNAGAAAPDFPDEQMDLPAVQERIADRAENNTGWEVALQARWRAVNVRPFTFRVRHHLDKLRATLDASPQHSELVILHRDVDSLWQSYRQSADLPFGDYGLLYQSHPPTLLPGSRDTDIRRNDYDLDTLVAGRRVLDLGCNVGFLSLAAAKSACHVTGVDNQEALIAIAEKVADHTDVSNCTFVTADASTFQGGEPFDVIIAAAVHGWLDLTPSDFAGRMKRLTAPGGVVLLESQGQRSTTEIELGFGVVVRAFRSQGFDIQRDGTVCDDRVNLRAFVVLRKIS